MTPPARVEDLLRELAPQVLGVLVRRNRHFDACEDAMQEALLAASLQWPADGLPDNPRAWLITVASRRLVDDVRSEQARRRREEVAAAQEPAEAVVVDDVAPADEPDADDTLTLLFLCCHPALSPASQIALTLRAVGGLTTAEIAQAFLVPEATMAQRISRAKQRIKATGGQFRMPPEPERPAALRAVLHVLYLIFNEGYTASSGPDLQRAELAREAIRLTRAVHALVPAQGTSAGTSRASSGASLASSGATRTSAAERAGAVDPMAGEVAGLLALMLLTDARRPARTAADGGLIPLAEQDRSRWNAAAIAEGIALLEATLPRAPLGPYQLQAAIAAVHAEAADAEQTDWPQILALYRLLERIAPNPMVTLNHAVALAMVDGPHAGLALLDTLGDDDRTAGHHRVAAVRAHLLELAGDDAAALTTYELAARLTTSLPEQRYLTARARRLAQPAES